MKRSVGYIGAFGLVTLLFGLLGHSLLAYDEFHFIPIHFGIGATSILIFFVGGGLRSFRRLSVRKTGLGIGAILYTVLFIAVLSVINMWFSAHDPIHFDSTEQGAYTLAPETTTVLASLPKKVIARAFYLGGKADPTVESLLKRLAKASPNFTWMIIDPEKQPAMVDQYGVSQSGTIHFSFDEEGGKREAKIARDITEQEIVNGLLKLKRGEGKHVYAISGHGESDLDSQAETGFLFLRDYIQGENLKVQRISLGAETDIPEDAAVIMLLSPRKTLLPEEFKKIQEYLAIGGSAIFAAEPHTTTDIATLMKPLGISVGNDIIIDRSLSGFGVQIVIAQYGVHAITHDFGGQTIFTTTSSVARGSNLGEGAKVTEFAFSGDNSWAELDVDRIFSDKPEATLSPDERRGPVPVAVAYEGEVPYRAPDGSKQGKSRIVVFGDDDFVSNANIRKLYNADLFLNALNWALGEPEGITIRARTLKQSTKIVSSEQSSRVFLTAGVLFPEILLLLGLAVWWRRKS